MVPAKAKFMGTITAIQPQKRRGRMNVYVDDRYRFSLGQGLVETISIGQNIDEDEIRELEEMDLAQREYQQVIRLIYRRPRSEYEIRTHLRRRAVPDTTADRVIERLVEASLIDDRAFAELWIENRMDFRPRSRYALRVELQRKGIDRQIIEEALTGVDDQVAAEKAARIAARRWRQSPPDEFRRKVMGYLQRRGFSYPVCDQVVGGLIGPGMDQEDESEAQS
jgi:regulatory protein